MDRIEYRYTDKSKWNIENFDEFMDEPDKIQYEDEETGLPCLIVRGPHGALCGYVAVEADHCLFEKDHDCVDYELVDVHGGLTFSSKCSPREGGLGICHAPSKDESDNVWWFGFDCAHSGDYCPSYPDGLGIHGYETYKNIVYVQNQVKQLAKQLSDYNPLTK